MDVSHDTLSTDFLFRIFRMPSALMVNQKQNDEFDIVSMTFVILRLIFTVQLAAK